jgi:hypothetical protein
MESSKIIIYSTNMCWSYQGITILFFQMVTKQTNPFLKTLSCWCTIHWKAIMDEPQVSYHGSTLETAISWKPSCLPPIQDLGR